MKNYVKIDSSSAISYEPWNNMKYERRRSDIFRCSTYDIT